jgi:GH24 family phage-related lysozyme (muramidase)
MFGGGVTLAGLATRREAEVALFISPTIGLGDTTYRNGA